MNEFNNRIISRLMDLDCGFLLDDFEMTPINYIYDYTIFKVLNK
jgi:hypothetical protein